jgi:hypothetical protein
MAQNPYTFDYNPPTDKLSPSNTYINNTRLDTYPDSPESKAMASYFSGSPGLNITGNPVEVSGSITGLQRGKLMYGQDLAETGQKIQAGAQQYEDRLNGRDPITEALKQQKQQSQANVARNMAGRGVAGGVAAAAQEQAGRQKDIDIAASAYQQNAQNLKDYTNLQSTIAANQGTLEQLYRGNAVSGVQLQPVKNQTGLLGL